GNFRNRVNVLGELQQASLVRGGAPVRPSAANMNFTNRAAAASGPRSDFNNQRFFSRTPVNSGGAQRIVIPPQQAGARAAGEARPGAGVNGGTAGRANGSPGWQRFGSPQPAGERQQFVRPQGGAGVPSGNNFQPGTRSFEPGRNFGGQPRSL